MSIAEVQVEAEIETFADKDPWYSVALDLIKRKPLGAAGAFIVLIMILMALFAELIAPFDPELNSYEYMLVGPDWTFLLGTDQFGSDIFSRIVYGARTALFVGFVSAFVGSAIGLVLGVTSAYFGGKFDLVFQRVMDVFMSFPLIILALWQWSQFLEPAPRMSFLRSPFLSYPDAQGWSVPTRLQCEKFPTSMRHEPAVTATPGSFLSIWCPT